MKAIHGSSCQLSKEVIVVDDASTDGTAALIRHEPAPQATHFIEHETNRGKEAAVRSAYAAATGDVVIIQDADLEYDPDDYGLMVEPFVEDKAAVVYGSRFASGGPHRVRTSGTTRAAGC